MIINTSAEALAEISNSLKRIKSILADVRDQSNYKSPLHDCKEQHIQESLSNISHMVDDAAKKIEAIDTRLGNLERAVNEY